MTTRIVAFAFASLLLAGCAPHEGRYAPGCVAYAGSIVTLEGGTFVWEKFSDQIILDADGNTVDQYPDYPMRGSYRLEGAVVTMESASGRPVERLHLHRRDGGYLLLSAKEQSNWEQTGDYADCVLTLGAAAD